MKIVTEAIKQYVESQKKTWPHDRRQTIGASEIGQCARKIFCIKFEDDPDMAVPRDSGMHDPWGARERGNLIEKYLIVPAMRLKYGHLAMFMGEEQKTFFYGDLSVTPDCILRNGEYIPVEFKTIDPRANLLEPKPEHVYQVQMQMGILNALKQFPCKKAIISYTDASFLSETKEFEIEFEPAYFESAQKRARSILTAERMADVEPEGYIAGGKECQYCPFSNACGYQRRDVPDETGAVADPQFVAEISDLARQYKFAQSAVDLSEKQVRELQTQIKTRLQDKQLRRVVGNGVSVSWNSVKGREKIDTEGLRSEAVRCGIDLSQFISTGESTDRLTVTVKSNP
jgi:CRISPR/Cas system-associated exonuclease Cas4 (RecB family)